MTSESDLLKTNEFLRRRKLRLQQVREQSKDIAKKLRQRAKLENSRQNLELDSKKEKEYFLQQNKLIKRLEELYAQGVSGVGVGHQKAAEVGAQEVSNEKLDVSIKRGKEAAAELKRQKQAKLDIQKKQLDRKLLAREVANELSREKSAITLKKNTKTVSNNIPADNETKVGERNNMPLNKNDMGTQWDFEEMPNEWEPNIPSLSLPKDDRDSLKESINIPESNIEHSKKIDLFALSSEMPSSLRGGLNKVSEERTYVKPKSSMVSEYLQSRALRLRESDTVDYTRKKPDDFQSLKETIMRTRTSKPEGNVSRNICHVLDEQFIPVPSWQAESYCEFCTHNTSYHKHRNTCQHVNVTNTQINKIYSTTMPLHSDLRPDPVVRGSSPFRRNKVCQRMNKFPVSAKGNVKSVASSYVGSVLNKKSSVTIYNHSTRNTRDVPSHKPNLVVRDIHHEEDAYSQALKEVSNENSVEEHVKRLQEMRNKVAMTKQSVDKEYNDTMSFLKSLPKEKCSKHVKTSFMDDRRQQMMKDRHQQKLRQEFKKIEKECRSNDLNTKSNHRTSPHHHDNKSASIDLNENDRRDFQYSWMPVPESDDNLAIHTIPTTVRQRKSGNSVKFSKVDSYHEYRSRHKHTPPTKDTDNKKPSKTPKTVLIENEDTESTVTSSLSDTSSVENLNLSKSNDKHEALSDSEKIIIYKVLNTALDKRNKKRKKLKLIGDVAKVLSSMDKGKLLSTDNKSDKEEKNVRYADGTDSTVPLNQINEGVYKTVTEKGDNMSSLNTSHRTQENVITLTEDDMKLGRPCTCARNKCELQNEAVHCGSGDVSATKSTICLVCKCGCLEKSISKDKLDPVIHTSATTSTSSFKTATTADKAHSAKPDGGFIQLLDDEGQAGKFYIGASGFIKDDAYEVLIQLRKKDTASKDNDESDKKSNKITVEDEPIKTPETKKYEPPSEHDTVKKSVDAESANVNETALYPHSTEGNKLNINELTVTKEDKNKPIEKAVCTTSQESFAFPDDFPKTENIPRPATSTYTQTSFNSTPKPVFIHMSSSTSTAYMSPPEMVLPKCLRNYDKIFTNKDVSTSRDERFEITEHHIYDEEYTRCTCKRCMRYEKIVTEKLNTSTRHRKKKCYCRNFSTPPNTARTNNSENMSNDFIPHKVHKKGNKCDKRSISNKKRRSNLNKLSSRNMNTGIHMGSTASKAYKNKVATKIKSHINPVVKTYVNRLLELNRNSLKAIEITNQNCSSIGTPGSSIIDVPHNVDENKNIENKISLQQVKDTLRQQIIQECLSESSIDERGLIKDCKPDKIALPKLPTYKRCVHRVKSLNISKKISKPKKTTPLHLDSYPNVRNKKNNFSTSSESPSLPAYERKPPVIHLSSKSKSRSKSLPTPRPYHRSQCSDVNTGSDLSALRNDSTTDVDPKSDSKEINFNPKKKNYNKKICNKIPLHKATITTHSSEQESIIYQQDDGFPTASSTQTNNHLDSDLNLLKLAEDKIQNMEKIADLTEKCTKRLSSLAKVLEEVRRNKSLAYSHISTSETASDSERKSDKNCGTVSSTQNLNDSIDEINHNTQGEKIKNIDSTEYIPFLKDIPKPEDFKYSAKEIVATKTLKSEDIVNYNIDGSAYKCRTKPPPALSRIHLKNAQDIIPHELSTVIEVDSPISVKLKNQTSKCDVENQQVANRNEVQNQDSNSYNPTKTNNPDILRNNNNESNEIGKFLSNVSSDDTQLKMMDLKQFNDVMLKPFISIREYAKQNDFDLLDDGSNIISETVKDDVIVDELSSLHSDGSLPDVIAELLKRNVIAEPFKYDTISNVNSTTVSSESTISLLALSKTRREKKKGSVMFKNQENISETSDTLSMSSNPDLESAFKNLGMGWASSTLKKTKERLALSSSSNTSSSSLTQFKMKTSNSSDVPALVTDAVLAGAKISKKSHHERSSIDTAKSAQQQTSFMNSMTVKEFLTKELAKRITFSKSNRNDTEDEFVSLIETKMPDEIKDTSQNVRDRSADSAHNGNNRARTSTPVQLFKSLTYHSSSSSNVSNGLFSNADDLSSVKGTSNSIRNHSTSEKDDLTIPNCSLKLRKDIVSDCTKSD